MNKPEHLGYEYSAPRWHPLFNVGDVRFEEDDIDGFCVIDVTINGVVVGSLEPRPHYCDRGHWKFLSDLPDIDGADGFPRYYMNIVTAKLEIISWLNWRLWRRRVG
jgi:hypothetical protein